MCLLSAGKGTFRKSFNQAKEKNVYDMTQAMKSAIDALDDLLCRWNIYEDDYYLLQGDSEKKISRYNTLDPGLWNV